MDPSLILVLRPAWGASLNSTGMLPFDSLLPNHTQDSRQEMQLKSLSLQRIHLWLSSSSNTILLVTLLLCVPLITSFVTSRDFHANIKRQSKQNSIPKVPYTIPFLGHALSLARSPGRFIAKVIKQHGYSSPLAIKAGTLEFTAVANPEHIQTIFKSSKQLTSKPATIFALRYLLGAPASVIPLYEADDSGMGPSPRKGSQTQQKDRIHFHQARATQRFLSGQHLHPLADRYLKTLTRNLTTAIDRVAEGEWFEHPDLYSFLQEHVSRSAIETLMGSKILELNPTIVEDFWTFDRNVPLFVRCLPRWLMPGPYRSRDRLLTSIKKWHAHALEHSDCERIGADDPEWDPYFGSKLIRARQEYSLKMKPMTADARASEDLGLMFAANANILPSIFWYILEALRDDTLRDHLMSEVNSCLESEDKALNVSKLCAQPLLQSAHAEVLRLRVAIAMSRTSELEDFNLDSFKVRKNQTLMIFSRPPALNEEAWSAAGRSLTSPLSEFQFDRFIIPKSSKNSREGLSEGEDDLSPSEKPEFSLDGLAGLWLPYGGGQRMCPGRHFAKAEVLSTFALLFTEFVLEVKEGVNVKEVAPDLRWVPTGALPPTTKVPFRIRRKIASS